MARAVDKPLGTAMHPPPPPQAMRPSARRGPSGAWSRLKPVVMDPLDCYGLPSKGEERLHDHKNQESYYNKIVERYMKFCASTSSGANLEGVFAALSMTSEDTPTGPPAKEPQPPASNNNASTTTPTARPTPHDRPSDIPTILLAMRKLREGILATRRRDAFAQRTYMFIAHAGILAHSWETYHPALLYLLDEIHRHTPLTPPELREFVGYRVLDLACRQYELVEAFEVRSAFGEIERSVSAVLHAVVHDDWVRFWRVKRGVDGYQRAIMEFAAGRVRTHALKCLGKSYLSVNKAFVERSGDADWEELVQGGVGWQLQENGTVVIRQPRPK